MTVDSSSSEYFQIKTGYGPLHVHINYDESGPKQIFTNISPLGTEIAGLTALVGILLTKYLEVGGNPNSIIKHLNSIKGDKPHGLEEARIDSIPHAVAIALQDYLDRHTVKGISNNG